MGRSAGAAGGTRLMMARTTSSAMRLPYTKTLCVPPSLAAAGAAAGGGGGGVIAMSGWGLWVPPLVEHLVCVCVIVSREGDGLGRVRLLNTGSIAGPIASRAAQTRQGPLRGRASERVSLSLGPNNQKRHIIYGPTVSRPMQCLAACRTTPYRRLSLVV